MTDYQAPCGNAEGRSASRLRRQSPRLRAATGDNVPGKGSGIVDVFDLDGTNLQRFAEGGHLKAPWGMAHVPSGFGALGDTLWIGNFGDGQINAFNPDSGAFIDKGARPQREAACHRRAVGPPSWQRRQWRVSEHALFHCGPERREGWFVRQPQSPTDIKTVHRRGGAIPWATSISISRWR